MHALLKLLDPPYVYNVKKGDRKGFANAIKSAIENPIDRYVKEQKIQVKINSSLFVNAVSFAKSFVLDRMMLSSVEERIKEFFAKDWKAEAEKVIAEDSTLKALPQVSFFFDSLPSFRRTETLKSSFVIA